MTACALIKNVRLAMRIEEEEEGGWRDCVVRGCRKAQNRDQGLGWRAKSVHDLTHEFSTSAFSPFQYSAL